MSESEKLAFDRAIEEIGEGGFIQQNFKSSRGDKTSTKDAKEDGEFNFGTQAELSSRQSKFIPLSDDSLFSPHVRLLQYYFQGCFQRILSVIVLVAQGNDG